MLTALLLMAAASIEVEPTDDVWVYPHASDPSKDVYLRVWGNVDRSVATSPTDIDEYSYSYLRFAIDIPAGKALKSASLVLFHVGEPVWTLEDSKKGPIEVRPLNKTFEEKGWNHPMAYERFPDKERVFGAGSAPETGFPPANDFPISITLDKGDFAKYVAESGGVLNLALTSKLDPSAGGMRAVYKLWSRNADAKFRPKLKLEFAD